MRICNGVCFLEVACFYKKRLIGVCCSNFRRGASKTRVVFVIIFIGKAYVFIRPWLICKSGKCYRESPKSLKIPQKLKTAEFGENQNMFRTGVNIEIEIFL